jgi:hypothetical protein
MRRQAKDATRRTGFEQPYVEAVVVPTLQAWTSASVSAKPTLQVHMLRERSLGAIQPPYFLFLLLAFLEVVGGSVFNGSWTTTGVGAEPEACGRLLNDKVTR